MSLNRDIGITFEVWSLERALKQLVCFTNVSVVEIEGERRIGFLSADGSLYTTMDAGTAPELFQYLAANYPIENRDGLAHVHTTLVERDELRDSLTAIVSHIEESIHDHNVEERWRLVSNARAVIHKTSGK